jgi:hypothetical protein
LQRYERLYIFVDVLKFKTGFSTVTIFNSIFAPDNENNDRALNVKLA